MVRGVRGRLVATVIGLVALTSLVLGVGSYAYVAGSLRGQQLDGARDLTTFNVAVLAVERLPAAPTRQDLVGSHLLDGFATRGIVGTIVDFGDGDPFASNLVAAAVAERLSPGIRSIVATGHVGFERLALGEQALLVTGARRPPSGPDFYFVVDASGTEDAIARLGQALLVGGLLLVALAALTGGILARRLLRPVASAASAAERIAAGDLSARLEAGSGDELAQWARSFNRMATSLEEKIELLENARAREQRFVADVSHELRTPLTALVQEASLLRDHLESLPDVPRRVGALLVADVGRLRALVDDLVEISRFDAGAEQLMQSEIDIVALVRSLVAARAPDARVSAPAGPVPVVTDRRRLERVLGNLLDNARVHGEARDVEVDARLERDEGGGWLVVGVADRGPGVEPGQLPRLFERFHKADPSRHQGGSGLGLAIAREHARLLGGTLEAALQPGGGLRVELRVPVTQPLPGGDETVTAPDEPAGETESRTEPLV